MPKGYWIARVDVHDPETYRAYVAANGPVFAAHGARFLVRGGAHEVMEGTARARNVVIEFPNYEAALACYRSEAYAALLRLRAPAGTADLVVIEGYDPPA